jgi:hypothetical protein
MDGRRRVSETQSLYAGDWSGAGITSGGGRPALVPGSGSVLSNRILYQDTANSDFSNTLHPVRYSVDRLAATPQTMPLAHVTYDLDGQITYADMHPYINTGDVNAAPVPALADGTWGNVVAAGRP